MKTSAKTPSCPHEAAVLAAVRPRPGQRGAETSEPLAPELSAHLAGCAPCRRAAALSGVLGRLATVDEDPLPDPSRLYWRARVLARLGEQQEAAERATRPLAWAQRAAAVLAAGAATAALAVGWDLVASLLGRLPSVGPAAAVDPSALAALAAGLAVALLAGGGLAVLQALSERT